MDKYVTYGLGNIFYPEKLKINLHCVVGKPMSAWWGSPINAEYGWKEWCTNEEWIPPTKDNGKYFSKENRIIWTLSDDSKLLMINEPEDLIDIRDNGYIITDEDDQYIWDFNKVLEDYDAIQLNDGYIGHYFIELDNDWRLESIMNTWDCDSIVVLNPDKIIILEDI